jgi:hypothetical protein
MSQTEWSTIEPTKGEEQEKVEFEIEGQEEQQEQIEAVAPEPQQEQPKAALEEEDTNKEKPEELEGIETSGAQKRIRQLVKQKKEREEEIEKLVAANKEMQIKLQSQEDEYKKALVENATSSEGQVKERLELARDAYRRAVDSGDSDLILRAQEALNSAQQDTVRFTEYKKQLDSYTVQQPQPQEAYAQQPQQQQYQAPTYEGYDMKAVQWASKNEWFNSDQIMTAAALTIDAQLKEEGFDPTEDEFYEEVDKRLAETFPHKFGGNNAAVAPVPQETSQPAQVVAGASRTPATSSSKKVKLTQEDVRLADKWGISLEQYAAEKLKVERAEGEYTTINR